ncbi:MAG: Cyclic nucleotide-regulated FAD-dependent pyridine nucleotide-disulfide oxidoreductase [Xanthomonadaceae bacterium]|nr:Cyclic nucleotide-regulated FAD-dependent pyridine nucleotide-disulfide oxidoreductase [Xanthomonadaceae bacterium]
MSDPDLEGTYKAHFDGRRAQAFPTLLPDEIDRLRRYAQPRRYANGDRIYETGKASPGMLVILSGLMRVTGRDGHGHDLPVVDHRPGSFSGELGQLSGRRSFVDAIAVGDVDALLLAPADVRALLVSEALLGERIMRALILRRVALLEAGAGGPVLIGPADASGVARLRNFLTRNAIPHQLLDSADDAEAKLVLERYAPTPDELPLVLCPDGSVLRNPTEVDLARCIGMLDTDDDQRVFDVVIAGAGPAGLPTAVYAASEGLATVVVDARAFGGQAGASARIENYLGFPTGISGQALTGRAYTQAQKFGARMLIPAEAIRLHCNRTHPSDPLVLALGDGRMLRSRAVVIATGARYRRPDCTALRTLEGRGVWYWASPLEARMCAGQHVVLVGGGNSAGQAAVFLSTFASRVTMLIRGPTLAASMSRYLIERIQSHPAIELLTRTQIVDVTGSLENGLQTVRWRNLDSGAEQTHAIHHVFLFMGADPETQWLSDCHVALDDRGFVQTGVDTGLSLETSVAGVFAAGDVRSGSVKRVGGAIGEGAAAVAQIHAHIAAQAG